MVEGSVEPGSHLAKSASMLVTLKRNRGVRTRASPFKVQLSGRCQIGQDPHEVCPDHGEVLLS